MFAWLNFTTPYKDFVTPVLTSLQKSATKPAHYIVVGHSLGRSSGGNVTPPTQTLMEHTRNLRRRRVWCGVHAGGGLAKIVASKIGQRGVSFSGPGLHMTRWACRFAWWRLPLLVLMLLTPFVFCLVVVPDGPFGGSGASMILRRRPCRSL